jgi:hypothetical protein
MPSAFGGLLSVRRAGLYFLSMQSDDSTDDLLRTAPRLPLVPSHMLHQTLADAEAERTALPSPQSTCNDLSDHFK